MIEALSLQDPSKPLNVSFINKKTGQNYMYNQSQTTNTASSLELNIPSITFNKQLAISTKENTPKIFDSNTSKSEQYDITFIKKDVVCIIYVFFAILMAMINLLMPAYQIQAATLISPLFTIAIVLHSILTQSWWNAYIGITLIFLYPFVLVFNTYLSIILIFSLFTLFCVYHTCTNPITNYVHMGIIFFLVVCSFIGIIIYQIYPRSIHGIHASFLSTCILACTVVVVLKKNSFKLVVSNNQ